MANADKKVYLTFDDGPIPEITEFVLETLEKYQAKATFFCVGDNIQKHPAIFKQVLVAGHSVGNHTFNHLKGWSTPNPDYIENIRLCKQIMLDNDTHAKHSKLFRPPYGRIKTTQYQLIKSEYDIIMWDVLTNDYDRSLSEELCLQKSLQYTQSGSIVVFHDSLKAEKNLRYVLPRYLKQLSNEGFSFEAIEL